MTDNVKQLNSNQMVYVLNTGSLKTVEDIATFLKTLRIAVMPDDYQRLPEDGKRFLKPVPIHEYQTGAY